MRNIAIIISGRRQAALLAVGAAAALTDAARALVEVIGAGTTADFVSNTARVGGLARGMISPLEDSAGMAFSDGEGGVLHIIG